MQKNALHIAGKSQQELVAALKANNESVMKALYVTNYRKVKTFVLQNNGSESDAKDIYQEAFITVWKKVQSDKFTPKNDSSLNGYLYQIAKNKWIDYLRSAHHKKTVSSDSELRLVSIEKSDQTLDDKEVENDNLKMIMDAFARMGERCKNILKQFYFNRKNYREIADDLDMQEASVRNQKYRCMQKLRSAVLKSENK